MVAFLLTSSQFSIFLSRSFLTPFTLFLLHAPSFFSAYFSLLLISLNLLLEASRELDINITRPCFVLRLLCRRIVY